MSADEPRPDLARLLDAWRVPPPRAALRDGLRERFLAGEAPLDDALDAWDVPDARPEFRAACRERFLCCEERLRRGRPVLVGAAVALAAAAALLLAWLRPWGAEPPALWRALEGVGRVVLDGRELAANETSQLGPALQHGCSVEAVEGDLRVLSDADGVLLEVGEGTRVEVLAAAPGAAADVLELRVDAGALRVSTRADFGGRVHVRTPDAAIDLAGRALGVDVSEAGTCLCILEGEARLASLHGGGEREVLTDASAFVPRAGGETLWMEGELHHGGPLLALSELQRALWP